MTVEQSQAECIGGPKDGQRLPVLGREVRVPLPQYLSAGEWNEDMSKPPTMRIGRYVLSMRKGLPVYRWKGEE